MAFLDKLGNMAKNLGDKTSAAIETVKLNTRINVEKEAIQDDLKKVGEYFYLKRQTGDSDIDELYAVIDKRNQMIADMQVEIERIKADSAATSQQPQTKAPSLQSEESESVICPECGKQNPSDTKFCPECGGRMESPAPEFSVCPFCNAATPPRVKFCEKCGHGFS